MSETKKTRKTNSSQTKSGSSGSVEPRVQDDGSLDLASVPRRPGPGKGGAALQEPHVIRNGRRALMDPIPESAAQDPMGFAEKHIESLAPEAAKEIEYALKFGSDERRYTAAKDALAMKGLTTKPKEAAVIPQAMVFQFNGPVSPQGVPILPFSNAAPALPAEVDTAPGAVTIDAAPAKKDGQ